MLTALPNFAGLEAEASKLRQQSLADLMTDPVRGRAMVADVGDLSADYSRQLITPAVLDHLIGLALDAELPARIKALFDGEHVNLSEDRAVSHMALRTAAYREGKDFARLADFADQVRESDIAAVVNIGIGGSDLGPAMLSAALAHYQDGPSVHYVSNIDPSHLHDVLAGLDPASTLIIVTSKTFTTVETMQNAALARDWLITGGADYAPRIVAVTAAPETAINWGVLPELLFDFDEAVGGRYSLWSAVGLPVMIGIGPDNFAEMLAGAGVIDNHFSTAPMAHNVPVILGLLRVWNRNFLGHSTHGIMPYDQRLALLPAWAQQLEMESNGKSVSRNGAGLDYPTAPVIWGAAGTGCQHSFFQALHQGSDIVPMDILVPLTPSGMSLAGDWQQSHQMLVANALAQAEALAIGSPNTTEPHRHFAGNRPSTLISWRASTPHVLGQLLALYEHITVVSGFIWDVNSFDQWGVELGKVMATRFAGLLVDEAGLLVDEAGLRADENNAGQSGLSVTAADLLARMQAYQNPETDES